MFAATSEAMQTERVLQKDWFTIRDTNMQERLGQVYNKNHPMIHKTKKEDHKRRKTNMNLHQNQLSFNTTIFFFRL